VVEVSSREPEGWAWSGNLRGAWYRRSGSFPRQQQDCPSVMLNVTPAACLAVLQMQGESLGPRGGEHGHVLNTLPD